MDTPVDAATETPVAGAPEAQPEQQVASVPDTPVEPETIESLSAKLAASDEAVAKSAQTIKQMEGRLRKEALLQSSVDALTTKVEIATVTADVELSEPERRAAIAEVHAKAAKAAQAATIAQSRKELGDEIELIFTEAGVPLDPDDTRVGSVLSQWQEAKTGAERQKVVLKVTRLASAIANEKLEKLSSEIAAERKRGNQEEGVMNMGTGANGAASVPLSMQALVAMDTRGMTPAQLKQHGKDLDAAARSGR